MVPATYQAMEAYQKKVEFNVCMAHGGVRFPPFFLSWLSFNASDTVPLPDAIPVPNAMPVPNAILVPNAMPLADAVPLSMYLAHAVYLSIL